MKIYGFPFSPNTRRVLFMLHEIHAEHEFVPIDLTQGEHRSPEYLKLNPNGRVPCLVDQDFILWESNAILQYLAARFPEHHLGGERPRERADIACWLFLNAAHLGPAVAHIFAHTMRLPEEKRIPLMVENGRAEVARCCGVMDEKLSKGPWLAGSNFTIADISVAATTSVAPMLGIDLSPYPYLSAWEQRVSARPAYRKTFTLAPRHRRDQRDHVPVVYRLLALRKDLVPCDAHLLEAPRQRGPMPLQEDRKIPYLAHFCGQLDLLLRAASEVLHGSKVEQRDHPATPSTAPRPKDDIGQRCMAREIS